MTLGELIHHLQRYAALDPGNRNCPVVVRAPGRGGPPGAFVEVTRPHIEQMLNQAGAGRVYLTEAQANATLVDVVRLYAGDESPAD